MGKRLHPTKVLAIRSMLLETKDLDAISKDLDVSYNAVAYHKRRMEQIELNGGLDLTLRPGRTQLIGLGMEEVRC